MAGDTAPSQVERSEGNWLRTLTDTHGTLTPKAAVALVRGHLDPNDIRAFMRSSPARLLAIGLVLVIVCIVAGVVAALSINERQNDLNTLLDQTEPFASSAQQLYSSLSVADAAAATAFISGGIEPKAVRDTYTQAVGEAAAEVAGKAAGTEDSDAPTVQLLRSVATQLPVYAGLVETARANNRNGHPVGAAYLGEASTLMQGKILPSAEELHSQQSAAVLQTQHRYTSPPWLAFATLGVALVALLVGQAMVARRWKRVFNPGLMIATLVMIVAFGWAVIAGSFSAAAADRALEHGTNPLSRLTASRILAQQARSDETLKLARRDTSGEYDAAFDADIKRLRELLDGYPTRIEGSERVDQARDALDRWLSSHARMNDTLAKGDFIGASIVAVGEGATDSASAFTTLDKALAQGIEETRDALRSNIFRASKDLNTLAPGVAALALFATLWIALGLWPRLREYR